MRFSRAGDRGELAASAAWPLAKSSDGSLHSHIAGSTFGAPARSSPARPPHRLHREERVSDAGARREEGIYHYPLSRRAWRRARAARRMQPAGARATGHLAEWLRHLDDRARLVRGIRGRSRPGPPVITNYVVPTPIAIVDGSAQVAAAAISAGSSLNLERYPRIVTAGLRSGQ